MNRILLLVILGIIHISCHRQDWPDWRGKNRDAVWAYQYYCVYESVGYPAGSRASVVIHDGKAYSLGTMGHLFCFDAGTGRVLWQKDLNAEYEINMPIWGIASTPLLVDEKIIVHVSGSNNACVVAFNMDTGKEIWRIPWSTGMGMSIATPVLYEDHIFVSAFYSGSLMINLGDDYTTAEKVWQRSGESERETDALHCVMNTPVIIDDFIYGVDSYGELLITELSPGGLKEISRAKLIEPTRKQLARGVTWSHPAFANNHVFIRNDERLVCADLSDK
ncbi:MAG: PQQ-like beta-propeller repeat protein [Bacteroidales bacterium]|nr:PQQ-like beta-propeller repeat protein [Bacteroidales bacterium]